MLPKDILDQPDYIKRFEEEVLDGMITEKIMDLRAKELHISISAAELEDKIKEINKDYGEDFSNLLAQENVKYEQWKEDLKKEMLLQKLITIDVNANIKISEDEAEDYFNEHRDHYKTESRVRVAQIVVRNLAMAKKIETRLNAGEDFASVAAKVSIGPEAHRGGDLGFITRQIMPEPLDKTIFSLPVNKISPIVQSSYGFHIFKVLEIQPARIGNFTDIKEEVIADIRSQKEDAAFMNWLEALKMKAVIKKESNMPVKKVTGMNPKASFGNIS
jgi:parvulin-like peptidyl-prolyl isomerase